MDELDIDGLDIAALMALNARVVERLQFLHQQKTTAAIPAPPVGCSAHTVIWANRAPCARSNGRQACR